MNSFRALLLEISNSLTKYEVQDLKFACSDFIPAGKAENLNRPHELFTELERMNLLGENNKDFLASVFVRIGRSDLRNKLLGIKESPIMERAEFGRHSAETRPDKMVVSDSIINDIAEDVSTSWKMVARKLGLKETMIDNIEDENRRVADRAAKALHKWKEINGNKATVSILMSCLKKAGRTDLSEAVRDKVYYQGLSQRVANENEQLAPRLQDVNQQGTFSNMADLEPSQYLRQPLVPSFIRSRSEHPDAPFSVTHSTSAHRDEELSREEVAPAVNVQDQQTEKQNIDNLTDTSRFPVQDQTGEKQNIDKTDTSRFPVQDQTAEKQNIDKTDTSRFPVQDQTAEKQNIDKTDTSRFPVQDQTAEKQNIDKTDTSRFPVQVQGTEKENLDKKDTSHAPVLAQDVEKQFPLDTAKTSRMPVQEVPEKPADVVSSDTSRNPVQVEQMKHPPSSFGNFLNPAKYTVAKCIGHGGFAKVYLCYDKETGLEYAAKLVDLCENDFSIRQNVDALKGEVEILKKLDNPFIVRYCHTEEEENTLVLFMEYMKGGSIKARLNDEGPMAEPLVRKYTWQVLKGLEYLHENNITHRDIKGANVLTDENNNGKLADFGISKEMMSLTTGKTIKTKNAVEASTYWTSPELLLNDGYYHNTDCWSVGCLVIEMLTGRPPHFDLVQAQAIMKIVHNGVSPPPTCSPLATAFLEKCLIKDKKQRPTSSKLLEDPFPTLNAEE